MFNIKINHVVCTKVAMIYAYKLILENNNDYNMVKHVNGVYWILQN